MGAPTARGVIIPSRAASDGPRLHFKLICVVGTRARVEGGAEDATLYYLIRLWESVTVTRRRPAKSRRTMDLRR